MKKILKDLPQKSFNRFSETSQSILDRKRSVLPQSIPHTHTSVAQRALIVSGISHASFGCPRYKVVSWLRREGVWDLATKWEKSFLMCRAANPSQVARASWGLERLWMLGWSLKIVDVLDNEEPCGPHLGSMIPGPGQSTTDFFAKVQLREIEEISAQEKELNIYCDMILEGTLPENVKAGIILERSHALYWLVNGGSWDKSFKFK